MPRPSAHCEFRGAKIVAECDATAGSKRRSGGVPAEEIAGEHASDGFLGHLCFLERSPLRRLKTSRPSLSRMRNPIVRGGNATLRSGDDCARRIRSLNLEFGHD